MIYTGYCAYTRKYKDSDLTIVAILRTIFSSMRDISWRCLHLQWVYCMGVKEYDV